MTHVGVATDHVIESFRNDLCTATRTARASTPSSRRSSRCSRRRSGAPGFTVWAMVEVEADDALGARPPGRGGGPRVEQVVICTPDKDLAQCVGRRRSSSSTGGTGSVRDDAGVREKFGVARSRSPTGSGWSATRADGFPGLPGWGAKSAATVLRRYGHIEDIPHAPASGTCRVRGAAKLAGTLHQEFEQALLFKRIATLDTDVDVGTVDEWRWTGPTDELQAWADRLDAPDLIRNAERLAAALD